MNTRRKNYKQKPNESDEDFRKRKYKISIKISTLKAGVKRFEQKEIKMQELDNLIKEFMGVKLKLIGKCNTKNAALAKNIFYKYEVGSLNYD